MRVSTMSVNERSQFFAKIAGLRTQIARTAKQCIIPEFRVKYETYKADQLTYRKRVDSRSLWIFKAKGSNSKYLGLSLRKRADKLTNKITVVCGHKSLSKQQLKKLHALKHSAKE